MSKAYRKPLEFSKQTVLEALYRSDFCCEISGLHKSLTPEGYLQIHHRIGIYFYIVHKGWFNYIGISDDFMKSVNNAQPLSVVEHKKIHELDSFEYYKNVAIALLGIH